MAAGAKTEFQVLGPLAVVRDGERTPLPSGKAAALLAALLLEAPRPVSTSRLTETLWGERPPPSARNALQVHMSNVRRALRENGVPEQIVHRGHGYALEVEPVRLDLHRLADLRRTALRAAIDGEMEEAAALLRRALDLWQGPSLEGIESERLVVEAARLEEIRLTTKEEQIDAELSCGRALEVIDELKGLAAEHPLRERFCRLLMLALYRAERQAEALAAYRVARRRLAMELGIEPSSELQELERRILRHDPSLRLASPIVLREPGDAPRRRSVTVVACDFRAPEVADPEAWELILAPAVVAARVALERYEGLVETMLGSTVLAVFGAGARREGHTTRAARAALACREAVATAAPLSVELRLALESGPALAGAPSSTGERRLPLGSVPAETIRLAHAARPGEIVLGPGALERAADFLTLETQPPNDIPRLAAVVEGPAAVARTSRFVARRREVTALRRRFETTVRTSRPGLVTVVGVPGIGKTRLAEELAERIDGQCARGGCPEDSAQRTFWPLREALDELDLHDEEAIADTLRGRPEPARMARVIAETLGLADRGLGGEERAVALAALLDELAREAPLLLVVDDLQWAEPALLNLLAELVQRCTEPVLVLCLGRFDPHEKRAEWPGEVLELRPLSERESARIAASVLGRGAPSGSVEHVVKVSEGNPLFVEELASAIRDGQPADGESSLPASIDSLLADRLERLTPLEREAIERAAVEGQIFHLDGVAELCRDDRERVRETLNTLVRKDLLRPTRPPLRGHEAYRFRHALIRDAAYTGLPRQLRAELHERWVEWLEARVGEELASWESVAASHLETSLRIQRGLTSEAETSALELRTGELFAAAAVRAEAAEDVYAAVTLVERSLAHLPPRHRERVELTWRAMMLLVAMGRLDEATSLCSARAEESADAGLDDDAALLELARLVALTFAGIESPTALAAAMHRCTRAVRATQRPYLVATLEASIGWGHYHRCRIEPFLRRFTRAYEYAVRGSDRRQQAVALAWIAIGLVRGPLSVREAIGRCEAMIANDHVPRTLEAQVLLALAELHAMTGRRKLARALLERSTRIMVDLRLDWIAARLTPHAATVELLIGDREAARARLQSGYSVLEAVGAPAKGALLLARLAELAADEGRADEALELAMTCRSLALVDDELAQVRGRAAAARAHALRGEQTPALRLAHHVVRRASRTDEPVLRATAFTALADACLAAGESSDAVAALEAALAEFETKGHLVLARKTRRRIASLRKISSPTGRGRRPG